MYDTQIASFGVTIVYRNICHNPPPGGQDWQYTKLHTLSAFNSNTLKIKLFTGCRLNLFFKVEAPYIQNAPI